MNVFDTYGRGRVEATGICLMLMSIPAVILILGGVFDIQGILRWLDPLTSAKDRRSTRIFSIGCGCVLLFFSIGVPLLCSFLIQVLA